MLSFFTKRKAEKAAKEFHQKLLEQLRPSFPDLYENHQHWNIRAVVLTADAMYFNYTTHAREYIEKSGKKHDRYFWLKNLTISQVPFEVEIQANLIHAIKFSTKQLSGSIDLSEMKIEEMVTSQGDKYLHLVSHLSKKQQSKLEMEDSFEIELEGKKYFTILDMEDGNYIAIDEEKKVYRLHHDSYEQSKMLAPTIKDFLDTYDGDKSTLAYLFH